MTEIGAIKQFKPTTPGQRGRAIVNKPKGKAYKPSIPVRTQPLTMNLRS